jgi:hypothetical protein
MLQEKQFFLKCLEEGPLCQRKIANRMSSRFDTSPAAVKDALLREGLIELAYVKREGATQKLNHYFKLTKKKLKQVEQIQVKVKDVWEDGTPKSKNNAFDLSASTHVMFDKGEIARMTQKYNQNKPITVYSRA